MSRERISFPGKVVKKLDGPYVMVYVHNYGPSGDVFYNVPLDAEVGDVIRLTFEIMKRKNPIPVEL